MLAKLRQQLIACIAATFLLTICNLGYGQQKGISPYLGVSADLDSSLNVGWGIEAGIQVLTLDVGLEYGVYFYNPESSINYDPAPGGTPPPYPISTEQFWGVHAGYVLQNSLSLGIVILKSNQLWQRWNSVSGAVSFTKSFLNIGPDVRYSGIDGGHIYLAVAFTLRRGFKAGMGYIF